MDIGTLLASGILVSDILLQVGRLHRLSFSKHCDRHQVPYIWDVHVRVLGVNHDIGKGRCDIRQNS